MATLEEKLERARAMTTVTSSPQIPSVEEGGVSFGALPKKTDPKLDRARRMQEGIGTRDAESRIGRGVGMILRGVDNITLPPAQFIERQVGGIRFGGDQTFVSPEEAREDPARGFAPPGLGEPQDPFERGMEFMGETITLAGPFNRALALVPPGVKTTLLGKAQRFARLMGKTGVRRPGRAVAIEGAAGFGAGAVGRGVEEATGSPALTFIGEILGGIVGPGIAIPVALRARNYLRTKFEPYGQSGATRRGTQRFERAFGGEQQGRERALRGLEEPTTLDPETGLPVLTPAQRTGDVGAMEFEKDVMSLSDELAHKGDEKIALANRVLQQRFREDAGQATPAETQAYLMSLFDVRLRQAAYRMEDQLAKIDPGGGAQSRIAANKIYDEELRRITEVLDKQIDELFQGIPPDAAVPSSSAVSRMKAWESELGRTGAKHMPPDAKKFLSPTIVNKKGQTVKNPQYVGEMTTVREMRNLQSSLRDHAREARKNGKFTSAEIADEIGTAINDDLAQMQAHPDVHEKLDLAVNFARDTNQILNKFKLGQMGGRSFTISNRPTDPSLAAEVSIGLGGTRGKAAYDQIIKAIRQTNVPSETRLGQARQMGVEQARKVVEESGFDFEDVEVVTDRVRAGELMQRVADGWYTVENVPEGMRGRAEQILGNEIPQGSFVGRLLFDETHETPTAYIPSMMVREGESSDVMRDAARQYFRSLFMDTVEGNEVNVQKATAFMKRHRPMLEVLPDLRKEIEQAVQGQEGLNVMRAQLGRGKYKDVKMSKAAMFTQKDPYEFFRGALKENPDALKKEMKKMWDDVNRDELGHAQRGLKGAWTDFLLTAGKTGQREVRDDTPFVSGAAIKSIMDSEQGKVITRTLFTPRERQRLRTVVNDMVKLERRRRLQSGSKEGVLGDKPNFLQNLLVRWGGAESARVMHERTGIGGSIQQVSMGVETFKKLQDLGVRDPALHFIISGINDEGLWKNVLMKPATPNKATEARMRKRIHTWAATMLHERGIQVLPDPAQEEEQQMEPIDLGRGTPGSQSSFAPGY